MGRQGQELWELCGLGCLLERDFGQQRQWEQWAQLGVLGQEGEQHWEQGPGEGALGEWGLQGRGASDYGEACCCSCGRHR